MTALHLCKPRRQLCSHLALYRECLEIVFFFAAPLWSDVRCEDVCNGAAIVMMGLVVGEISLLWLPVPSLTSPPDLPSTRPFTDLTPRSPLHPSLHWPHPQISPPSVPSLTSNRAKGRNTHVSETWPNQNGVVFDWWAARATSAIYGLQEFFAYRLALIIVCFSVTSFDLVTDQFPFFLLFVRLNYPNHSLSIVHSVKIDVDYLYSEWRRKGVTREEKYPFEEGAHSFAPKRHGKIIPDREKNIMSKSYVCFVPCFVLR